MIRKETATAMAQAIRAAIASGADDATLADSALQAFVSTASLSDWDELDDSTARKALLS